MATQHDFKPTLRDELSNARHLLQAERTRHGKVETALVALITAKDNYIAELNQTIEQIREAYIGQSAFGLKPQENK